MQTEIIDNKEYIKFPCKIGINAIGTGEAIIWVEKEELQKLLDPKTLCDHIFVPCDENGLEANQGSEKSALYAKCYKCGYKP